MKVLVSGAGGFLGRQVVERLLKGGHSVRSIIRPAAGDSPWQDDVEIFRADLRGHGELVAAFDNVDVVVHLAAATSGSEDAQFASSVIATEKFLGAMARSGVKRLVHVSSLVVYDWSRARGVIDEGTPLLDDMYAMGAYTIAKIWQERVVKKFAAAHSWDITILRPGFIWGPRHALIAGMGRAVGGTYLMFGPLTRLPLTHVTNCADCLAAAVENPAAIGEYFNVVDGDDIRVWRYVREYAKRKGPSGILLPVPYHIGYGLACLASLTSHILFGSKGKLPSLLVPRRFESQFKPLRFSTQKLTRLLSWKPPLTFEACLKDTYSV